MTSYILVILSVVVLFYCVSGSIPDILPTPPDLKLSEPPKLKDEFNKLPEPPKLKGAPPLPELHFKDIKFPPIQKIPTPKPINETDIINLAPKDDKTTVHGSAISMSKSETIVNGVKVAGKECQEEVTNNDGDVHISKKELRLKNEDENKKH